MCNVKTFSVKVCERYIKIHLADSTYANIDREAQSGREQLSRIAEHNQRAEPILTIGNPCRWQKHQTEPQRSVASCRTAQNSSQEGKDTRHNSQLFYRNAHTYVTQGQHTPEGTRHTSRMPKTCFQFLT